MEIGANAPISIQSMTNTDPHNVEDTYRQIKELEQEGCDIVRLALPDVAACETIYRLKERGITVPLVADIHFDYRIALAAAAAAGPYLAKTNLSEASSLPGYRRGMSAAQAAELTVECGAQRALVSNGGEPAAYCERGGRAVTLPVRKVKAVSTVGAGDAMLAAWIDGMLSGLGGAECAARGVEFAGRIITEPLP